MKRPTKIFQFEFVQNIPRPIEPGIIYISLPYSTAIHLCACGCGYEVVTKISPQRWQLMFDGETISLNPSIGNWNLPCRSHYWITNNRVDWAEDWSDKKIEKERKKTKSTKSQQKRGIWRFFRSLLF